MNKFTALISVGIATLFWTTGALADKPINKGMHKEIHKGKIQHHQGVKELNQSEILRREGQQTIKSGTELIKTGNKEEGKALIKQGTDKIHDANQLHREGVHDVHKGNRDIYEGKKNIRDRDHE